MVGSLFTTTMFILIALLVQVISQQPPNNLNQLLRGSQQQINSHAGSFAPGTKMFEEAHQAWLPKIPQRDSSGLPESTAAEQMSGAFDDSRGCSVKDMSFDVLRQLPVFTYFAQ